MGFRLKISGLSSCGFSLPKIFIILSHILTVLCISGVFMKRLAITIRMGGAKILIRIAFHIILPSNKLSYVISTENAKINLVSKIKITDLTIALRTLATIDLYRTSAVSYTADVRYKSI